MTNNSSLSVCTAAGADTEIVRVDRIGAMLNEPRRHGRGAGYIDATTVYDVTPDR